MNHLNTKITEAAKDDLTVTCADCDYKVRASDWITACRLATKHELKSRA